MKKYDKYKKTRNIWFPELPANWILTKVKYVARTIAGGTPSTDKPEFWDNGNIPWLPSGKLQNCDITTAEKFITEEGLNNSSTKWIKPNTTLIALTGATCANIGYLKFKACANQSVVAIDEVSENSNSRFMYYMFLSMRKQILTHQSGGAQAGINDSNVKNLYMVLPSLEEQTNIAQYLDHQTAIVDQLIQQKEKLIELLKEKRQAVINEAVTKGLNPNAKMKVSGFEWLGEVPKQWGLVQIRHLNKKVGSGVTPKGGAEVYTEEGVIFIRSQNVHFDGLRLDDVVKIDFDIHEKMSGSKVQFKDVLLNITGASIGRCCVVEIKDEINVNQHVCIIRPTQKILPEYLNLVLQSNVGQVQIKLGTTGGNREGLTFEAIKEFVIPLPDFKEQEEILSKIQSSLSRYYELEKLNTIQIEKIKEYRQSIISEAVTGKIDVRDWQPHKKQVA
ncbi:MAG: restriction endonuclease subunit S [Bacteroidetes bacterium]|nr:restriction endonuclease subunit S [Bacteroidota bacterium]